MESIIRIHHKLKVSSRQDHHHTAAVTDPGISQVVAGASLLGLEMVFGGGWTNTAFKQ